MRTFRLVSSRLVLFAVPQNMDSMSAQIRNMTGQLDSQITDFNKTARRPLPSPSLPPASDSTQLPRTASRGVLQVLERAPKRVSNSAIAPRV